MLEIQTSPTTPLATNDPTYSTLVNDGPLSVAMRYGLTVTTSVLSHSVLAPALTELITGRHAAHSFSQHLATTGIMCVTSLGVILGTLPVGHLIQRPDLAKGKKISLRTVTSATLDLSLATASQFGVALVYHQDLATALLNGLTRGWTRGFPISVIYRNWGDRPLRASVARQIANMAFMTNATTLTAIVSQPDYRRTLGHWAKPFTMAEIALVSALFYGFLSMKFAFRTIGPIAHVTPTEKNK